MQETRIRIRIAKRNEEEYEVFKQYLSDDILFPVFWEDSLEFGSKEDCLFFISENFPELKNYDIINYDLI